MSTVDNDKTTCIHCGAKMQKAKMPDAATWGCEFIYICFNDECPYYVRGWDWMSSKYNVTASYRYKYIPSTGETGPFPVWSETAMKSEIIPD